MTPFHFVMELILVVIALGVSHMLTGIAKMIHVGVSRWSPLLVGWIAFLLHEYFNAWFHLWSMHDVVIWSQARVMFLLGFTSLVFIASWLIMPETRTDTPVDQVAFYDANRRKFLGALAIYAFVGTGFLIVQNPDWYAGFSFWNFFAMFLCIVAAWLWADKRIQYASLIGAASLAANFAFKAAPVIVGLAGAE